MEGHRSGGVVVEEQLHREVLTSTHPQFGGEQPRHHIEAVRRIESLVKRPTLTELDGEIGHVLGWTVPTYRGELDCRSTSSVHDVTGGRSPGQRFREHERKRLLEVAQIPGRQHPRRLVAVLCPVE